MPITVLPVNQAPVVTPIANQAMDHDTALTVPVQATDPDDNPLKLTVTGLPAFATFIDDQDGAGQLTFSPGSQDRGNFAITVTATDDGDGLGHGHVSFASVSRAAR